MSHYVVSQLEIRALEEERKKQNEAFIETQVHRLLIKSYLKIMLQNI